MLHACVQRFDVTVTMQKILALFGHLNKALVFIMHIIDGDRAIARTAGCSSGEQPVASSRLVSRLPPHMDGVQRSYLSAMF
jgi:hypothetical protein